MSEQGWKDFLAADGLDDWAVLHGGPDGGVPDGSMVEAAQLGRRDGRGRRRRRHRAALVDHGRTPHRPADPRDVGRRSHTSSSPGPSRRSRASTARPPISPRSRRSRSPSPPSPTRSTSGSGARSSATTPMADDKGIDPLGHGSTVWMQDLDRAEAAAPRDAHRRIGPSRAR